MVYIEEIMVINEEIKKEESVAHKVWSEGNRIVMTLLEKMVTRIKEKQTITAATIIEKYVENNLLCNLWIDGCMLNGVT